MEAFIQNVLCPYCNGNNIIGHLGEIEEDHTMECTHCEEEINIIKNFKLEKDELKNDKSKRTINSKHRNRGNHGHERNRCN